MSIDFYYFWISELKLPLLANARLWSPVVSKTKWAQFQVDGGSKGLHWILGHKGPRDSLGYHVWGMNWVPFPRVTLGSQTSPGIPNPGGPDGSLGFPGGSQELPNHIVTCVRIQSQQQLPAFCWKHYKLTAPVMRCGSSWPLAIYLDYHAKKQPRNKSTTACQEHNYKTRTQPLDMHTTTGLVQEHSYLTKTSI